MQCKSGRLRWIEVNSILSTALTDLYPTLSSFLFCSGRKNPEKSTQVELELGTKWRNSLSQTETEYDKSAESVKANRFSDSGSEERELSSQMRRRRKRKEKKRKKKRQQVQGRQGVEAKRQLRRKYRFEMGWKELY
jgi:hypothetical protein